MKFDMIRAGVTAAACAAAFLGVACAQETANPMSDPENWREVEADRLIVMDTTKGRILIETAPEFAPNHVARFTTLIRTGFYDGIIFHRVIDDFMVQGGDPAGTGGGGTGSNINAEFTIDRDASVPVVEVSARDYNRGGFWNGMPVITEPSARLSVLANATVQSWISHCPGVMSTARTDNPNSADSQFFLMRRYINDRNQPNTYLDRQYTAWAHVVGGLDVVRSLNVGTVNETPGFVPDEMVSVKMASDMDEAERPRVWVMREGGPAFNEMIQSSLDGFGEAPDVCEIEIPTVVGGGASS